MATIVTPAPVVTSAPPTGPVVTPAPGLPGGGADDPLGALDLHHTAFLFLLALAATAAFVTLVGVTVRLVTG